MLEVIAGLFQIANVVGIQTGQGSQAFVKLAFRHFDRERPAQGERLQAVLLSLIKERQVGLRAGDPLQRRRDLRVLFVHFILGGGNLLQVGHFRPPDFELLLVVLQQVLRVIIVAGDLFEHRDRVIAVEVTKFFPAVNQLLDNRFLGLLGGGELGLLSLDLIVYLAIDPGRSRSQVFFPIPLRGGVAFVLELRAGRKPGRSFIEFQSIEGKPPDVGCDLHRVLVGVGPFLCVLRQRGPLRLGFLELRFKGCAIRLRLFLGRHEMDRRDGEKNRNKCEPNTTFYRRSNNPVQIHLWRRKKLFGGEVINTIPVRRRIAAQFPAAFNHDGTGFVLPAIAQARKHFFGGEKAASFVFDKGLVIPFKRLIKMIRAVGMFNFEQFQGS